MTREGVIEILSQLEESFGNNGHYLPNEWTHAPHIATIATQDEKAIWPDENMQIRFNTESDTLDTRRVSYKRQVNEPFYQDGEWRYFTELGNLRTIIKEGYWKYTGRDAQRPNTEDTYHEFQFKSGNKTIKLNNLNVKKMFVNGSPVEEINADNTLWFFEGNEKKEYFYEIHLFNGDIYVGTLNWTGSPEDDQYDSGISTLQLVENNGYWNIGNIETDVSTDEVFMLDKSSNYQSIRFQEIVSIALVTDRVKRAAYRYGNTL